jgi:hypothetical protein
MEPPGVGRESNEIGKSVVIRPVKVGSVQPNLSAKRGNNALSVWTFLEYLFRVVATLFVESDLCA